MTLPLASLGQELGQGRCQRDQRPFLRGTDVTRQWVAHGCDNDQPSSLSFGSFLLMVRAEPILRIPPLVLGPLCMDPLLDPSGSSVATMWPWATLPPSAQSQFSLPLLLLLRSVPFTLQGGSVTLQTLHPARLCSHSTLYDLEEEKSFLPLWGLGEKEQFLMTSGPLLSMKVIVFDSSFLSHLGAFS